MKTFLVSTDQKKEDWQLLASGKWIINAKDKEEAKQKVSVHLEALNLNEVVTGIEELNINQMVPYCIQGPVIH